MGTDPATARKSWSRMCTVTGVGPWHLNGTSTLYGACGVKYRGYFIDSATYVNLPQGSEAGTVCSKCASIATSEVASSPQTATMST